MIVAGRVFHTNLCLIPVFLLAAAVLGIGIERASIAAPLSDPVRQLRAQDESIHVSSSMAMLHGGDWGTPMVMGRPLLFKPPLLQWLAALSLKALGTRLLAVRSPALLFGALAAVLLFQWGRREASPAAGAAAALLLVSNPLWQTFSRLCYTDIPAAFGSVLALFSFGCDSALKRRRTLAGVAAGVAIGVMAKSVAGVLPLLVVACYTVVAPKHLRASWSRIAVLCLLVLLLAGPWHLYAWLKHPKWFWADYVEVQLLGVGLQPSTVHRSPDPLEFYLRRLVLTDPVLLIFAAIGVAAAARKAWGGAPAACILLCWLAVDAAALAVFQARNTPYLLFVVPPLALAGGLFGAPALFGRQVPAAALLLAAILGLKAINGDRLWGLSFGRAPEIASQRNLRSYCELGRKAELWVIDPDDEFYGITLPLRKIRYVFPDPDGSVARFIPHYAHLGVTMPASEFLEINLRQNQYLERLRDWGVSSAAPLASAILVRSSAELEILLRSRTDVDYYVPAGLLDLEPLAATHVIQEAGSRVFLLSRTVNNAETRACPLPETW